MANFTDCNTNSFSLETLLYALFAEEQNIALAETGQYAIRIVEKTADRNSDAITCDSKDTWEELFRRAIDLADDNKPALRVVITNRSDGTALEDVPNCGDYESLELLARNAFIMTTDGEVALNLANIT